MDLIRRFDAAAYERLVPWSATLELTLRCNLRCVHCYNFDRDAPRPTGRPLTRAEWFDVLEQLRAAGCAHVGLTGGEAMMHPEFFALLERAGRLALAASVLTNGTGLTDAAVERLARADHVDEVGLSVYGAVPTTHDAVTQVRGSFERTMRGAERLSAARVPVVLKYMVMDVNAGETEAFIRMAEARGTAWRADTYLRPRHDGDRAVTRRRASDEQLERLYRGPLRDRLPRGRDLQCGCARSNCAVTAVGDVYPCIAVPWRCGNVRERPFREIWEHSPQFAEIRALRTEDFSSCSPCALKSVCGRSPGPAYILTGDYTGVDPWICGDAEIRRRAVEAR